MDMIQVQKCCYKSIHTLTQHSSKSVTLHLFLFFLFFFSPPCYGCNVETKQCDENKSWLCGSIIHIIATSQTLCFYLSLLVCPAECCIPIDRPTLDVSCPVKREGSYQGKTKCIPTSTSTTSNKHSDSQFNTQDIPPFEEIWRK